MTKGFCGCLKNKRNVIRGVKCRNAYCYNFFTYERYKGRPRQTCSEYCRRMILKQGNLLSGRCHINRCVDIQEKKLMLQFKNRYGL